MKHLGMISVVVLGAVLCLGMVLPDPVPVEQAASEREIAEGRPHPPQDAPYFGAGKPGHPGEFRSEPGRPGLKKMGNMQHRGNRHVGRSFPEHGRFQGNENRDVNEMFEQAVREAYERGFSRGFEQGYKAGSEKVRPERPMRPDFDAPRRPDVRPEGRGFGRPDFDGPRRRPDVGKPGPPPSPETVEHEKAPDHPG